MGYARFKQKIFSRSESRPWLSMQRVAPHHDVRRPVAELSAVGCVISSDHSCGFFFGQENVE